MVISFPSKAGAHDYMYVYRVNDRWIVRIVTKVAYSELFYPSFELHRVEADYRLASYWSLPLNVILPGGRHVHRSGLQLVRTK